MSYNWIFPDSTMQNLLVKIYEYIHTYIHMFKVKQQLIFLTKN